MRIWSISLIIPNKNGVYILVEVSIWIVYTFKEDFLKFHEYKNEPL